MSDESDNNTLPSHGVKIVNRNNLSYRVAQLEKLFAERDKNTCAKIERLDERVDTQTLRTQEYYAVITPVEIKSILELTHRNELDIKAVSERFNIFQQDRVARLEVANEKIDKLKDDIVDSEKRSIALDHTTNELVAKNKIKNQQYVITVIVSIIAAIIISGVIGFLRL